MALALHNQAPFIERLRPGSQDLNDAADVLADAFMFGNPNPINPDGEGLPDPFYNRLNRGDQKVRELFRSIISLVSDIEHTIAVVRDGGEHNQIVGVCWIKERSVRDMSLIDFPNLIIPSFNAFGLMGALWYGWDVINHIPVYPTNTTYLSMLGVARSSQGKGIGRALVEYAIERAEGQHVVLSTMNPKNIKTYERLGFDLLPEKQTESSDSAYRPGFTTYHMAYSPSPIQATPNHPHSS